VGQKQAYQDRVRRELEKAQAHIEELRSKVENADEEVRDEYSAHLGECRRIRERAQARLEEIEQTDDENWIILQPSMDGILSELREAVGSASYKIE
jgi:chromosome segregation ATPase